MALDPEVGERGEPGDASLQRLGRGFAAWLTGVGLLRLHAGVLAVGSVALVMRDLYRSPSDLDIRSVVARWGILLALHAGVVVAAYVLRDAWRPVGARGGRALPRSRPFSVVVPAPALPVAASRFRPSSSTSLDQIRPVPQRHGIRRDRDPARDVRQLAITGARTGWSRARIWDRRLERWARAWWERGRPLAPPTSPSGWGQRFDLPATRVAPNEKATPAIGSTTDGWTRRSWTTGAPLRPTLADADADSPGAIRRDRSMRAQRTAADAPKDEVIGWRPQRDPEDRPSPAPEQAIHTPDNEAPRVELSEETAWTWLEAAAETRVARSDPGAELAADRPRRWSDGGQRDASFGD